MEKYKGIHPGIILMRELEKRSLKQSPFATTLGEHRQTFNAIVKGKRNIPTALALKIEKELQLEEGTFVLLQAFYDIEREKEKLTGHTPDLSKLRKSLFWDTNINHINWQKQSNAVIRRVYERGNDSEKKEIFRFYGQSKINAALNSQKTAPMQLHHKP
ncbi:helix-turn-helix transcriptional regulator [Niabella beijingensis]|uniref:helix-turn-helix transcriptional regulator n=1 Tax=Niabella beijingensis TaxID=2872700 RepID=UPI001CBD24C3|nr:hypothetical protein [Niabella beijingensis]MBZ4192621.1 hypothetical protein [Niabella beijingensis]